MTKGSALGEVEGMVESEWLRSSESWKLESLESLELEMAEMLLESDGGGEGEIWLSSHCKNCCPSSGSCCEVVKSSSGWHIESISSISCDKASQWVDQ